MTAEYINRCAAACIKLYDTSDARLILDRRFISVREVEGTDFFGEICLNNGRIFAYVNKNLGDAERKIILAKLAGHLFLHREKILSGRVYTESLNSSSSSDSKEASIFAAELLIPDATIEEMRQRGYTEGQLASALGALRSLLPFKLFSLKSRGKDSFSSSVRQEFLNRCDVEFFS